MEKISSDFSLEGVSLENFLFDLIYGLPFVLIPFLICVFPVFFIQPLLKLFSKKVNREPKTFDSSKDKPKILEEYLLDCGKYYSTRFIGSENVARRPPENERMKTLFYIVYHTLRRRLYLLSVITLFIILDEITVWVLITILAVDIFLNVVYKIAFHRYDSCFEYMLYIENSYEKFWYKITQFAYLAIICTLCVVYFGFKQLLPRFSDDDYTKFHCSFSYSNFSHVNGSNVIKQTDKYSVLALPFLNYFTYDVNGTLEQIASCEMKSSNFNVDFYKGCLSGFIAISSFLFLLLWYDGPSNDYYCKAMSIIKKYNIPFPLVYLKTKKLLVADTSAVISDVTNMLFYLKSSNRNEFPDKNEFTSHFDIAYFQFLNPYELGFLQYFFSEFVFEKADEKKKPKRNFVLRILDNVCCCFCLLKKTSPLRITLFETYLICLKFVRLVLIVLLFLACFVLYPFLQYVIIYFLTNCLHNFLFFFFVPWIDDSFDRSEQQILLLSTKVLMYLLFYVLNCIFFYFLYKLGVLNEEVDIFLSKIKIFKSRKTILEKFWYFVFSAVLNFFFFFALPAVVIILFLIGVFYKKKTYFDENFSLLRLHFWEIVMAKRDKVQSSTTEVELKSTEIVIGAIDESLRTRTVISVEKDDAVEDRQDSELVPKEVDKKKIKEFYGNVEILNSYASFYNLIEKCDHYSNHFQYYTSEYYYTIDLSKGGVGGILDDIRHYDKKRELKKLKWFQFELGRQLCSLLLKELKDETPGEDPSLESSASKIESLDKFNQDLLSNFNKIERRFETSLRGIKSNQEIVEQLSTQLSKKCIDVGSKIKEKFVRKRDNVADDDVFLEADDEEEEGEKEKPDTDENEKDPVEADPETEGEKTGTEVAGETGDSDDPDVVTKDPDEKNPENKPEVSNKPENITDTIKNDDDIPEKIPNTIDNPIPVNPSNDIPPSFGEEGKGDDGFSGNVHLQTLTGKTITISAEGTDSVSSLQKKIFEKEGIPPDQQRLIFQGQQLNLTRSLREYKIKKDSNIHMVLRLRGSNKKIKKKKALKFLKKKKMKRRKSLMKMKSEIKIDEEVKKLEEEEEEDLNEEEFKFIYEEVERLKSEIRKLQDELVKKKIMLESVIKICKEKPKVAEEMVFVIKSLELEIKELEEKIEKNKKDLAEIVE